MLSSLTLVCTARKVQEDIEVSWDSFGISALSLEVSHAALLSSLSRLLSRRKTKAIIFIYERVFVDSISFFVYLHFWAMSSTEMGIFYS